MFPRSVSTDADGNRKTAWGEAVYLVVMAVHIMTEIQLNLYVSGDLFVRRK